MNNKIIFRPYQSRDYNEIINQFKNYNKVLYQCPTGGGKSIVIAKFIEDNKDKKILFLSHKREIITQMYNRLSNLDIKSGFIMGSTEIDLDSKILIASISTLTRDKRIESILDSKYDIIVVDEAHRIRTKSYEKVLDHLFELNKDTMLFGVTATPYRTDKKSLDYYFESMVSSDTIEKLIEDGFLSQYSTYTTKIENIEYEVDSNSDDYQITPLSKFMRKPEYLQYLVDSYKKLGNNKQMIIFCVDKHHAKEVIKTYKLNGYNKISYIDSDTKLEERDNILEEYKQNKIQIIVCIETLTEGVDLPNTAVVQLARPTKSIILYLQMLGRGLRIKDDNSKLIVLDCSGNTKTHGVLSSPRTWSLDSSIDPSNLRRKNRIIAKKSNGTYTDDENEMDFLEIEEVSLDEYFSKIGMDVEKGKKINQEILDKQNQKLKEIGEYITKHSILKEYIIEKHNYYALSNLCIIIGYKHVVWSNQNKEYGICLRYDEDNKNFTIELHNISLYSDNQNLDYYIKLGKISEFLSVSKHNKFINSLLLSIKELKEEMIDVNKIEKQTKVHHLENFEIELDNYIKTNNELNLPFTFSIASFFRNEYSRAHINKIRFNKNKINKSSNPITFITEHSGTYEKNINFEKIKEIIFGRWDEIKNYNNI